MSEESNTPHCVVIPKEMDDVDRKLLILVAANPRIHFQELARKLGISRQAVHHRIQVLTKIGVVKGTTAGVSFPYLNAIPVGIFGRSRTASVEEALDRLGENEFTRRALAAGGNYLYVVGELRDISELDGYAEFVKQTADMPEPIVGIYNLDNGLPSEYIVDGIVKRKRSYKKLSSLDLKIIASLRDDARKSISDVAEMVEVSSRTVRRHLEDMVSNGSVDISMPVDLAAGGDMLVMLHVTLRDGVDKTAVGKKLLSKHSFKDAYIRTFSNLPGFLLLVFWSDKMAEIRSVLRGIDDDENVLATMLNFAYLERIYRTWRDRLPPVFAKAH